MRKFSSETSVIVIHNVAFKEYYGPECALVDFLNAKKIHCLLYVRHPVPPAFKNLASESELFRKGVLEKKQKGYFYSQNTLLLTLYNGIMTFYFILKSRSHFSVVVGSDARNAFVGIILRKLGLAKCVVFLNHSYGPDISNSVVNALERWLDDYCSMKANSVWGLSRKLTRIRTIQGVKKDRNIWVPVGLKDLDIKNALPFPSGDIRKRLVFVGVLCRGKGAELIINSFPRILKAIGDVELVIVGGGSMENELKLQCKKLGIEDRVTFRGYLEYDLLMNLLSECHLGIAPYEPSPNNSAFTTDPLKPKLYMACGLPVIITDFPETASEIALQGAGLVIHYSVTELENAVIKLLTNKELFEKSSVNAIKIANNYKWNEIFAKSFNSLGDIN